MMNKRILKVLIVIIMFLLMSFSAYPQSLYNSFNSKDKLNIQRDDDYFLFSFKSGYHTSYKSETENGFSDGMIFGADVNGAVTDNSYVGLSFEYWHNTDNNSNLYQGINPAKFSGWNISFNYTKRFRSKAISPNIGLGGGMYFTNRQDKFYDGNNSYFNLKAIVGMDIRLYDILWISPQIEYNNMFNFSNAIGMFSFKIGPTIILEN
jgi:hypothetical protein